MIAIKKNPDKTDIVGRGLEMKKEDNSYKGVFNYIFKDYEPLREKAIRSTFSHKDMIALTRDYHELTCNSGEDCIEFETNLKQRFLQFVVSAYAGITFSSFSSTYFKKYPNQKIYCTSPTMGGQFNLSLPRWKKSISLQADLSITKMHTSNTFINGAYAAVTRPNGYKAENLIHTFNGYSFINNIGLKYTAQQGLVRPVLEAGLLFENTFDASERLDFNFINPETSDRIRENNYSNLERSNSKVSDYYYALGVDFPLKNKDFILLRINREDLKTRKDWQIKLGYTF
jgi:hypothetical protein